MTEADKPAAQPSVRMPDSADFNAIVALGANIGDKVANVERARGLLTTAGDGRVELIGSSRIYKTPPWGITDQDWFVNSCISVRTDLDPNTLLRRCLDVEEAMGRRRTEKWGPRLIDLDVLVYEDRQDWTGAEIQWRAVTEEAPQYRYGWRGLGQVLLKQQKLGEARELAAGLSEQSTGQNLLRCEGLLLAARIAKLAGDPQRVEQHLQTARAEFPDDLEPLRELCQWLFERGDFAAAETALQELAELRLLCFDALGRRP